jgi:hypothetical protein
MVDKRPAAVIALAPGGSVDAPYPATVGADAVKQISPEPGKAPS